MEQLIEELQQPIDGAPPAPPAVALFAPQLGQLKEIWPRIRGKLSEIETPDDVIPEEVYAMCITNQATLFMLMVDGKEVGFMVCRLIAPDFHIWLLHADNGYEVLTQFREQLMEIAKKTGSQNITFGSRRRAWQQVAASHGFNVRMIVYACPVQ